MYHGHLLAVGRLHRGVGRIRWRGALLTRAVHVLVHRSLLLLLLLLMLLLRSGGSGGITGRHAMHSICIGGIRSLLHLCRLRLLLPLSGQSFRLLLLLHTRCGRPRCRLEIHAWLERPCELLLCDERVRTCLLRRPSLEWVNVEETMDEVNKSLTIGHFCHTVRISSLSGTLFLFTAETYLAPSRSASFPSWA